MLPRESRRGCVTRTILHLWMPKCPQTSLYQSKIPPTKVWGIPTTCFIVIYLFCFCTRGKGGGEIAANFLDRFFFTLKIWLPLTDDRIKMAPTTPQSMEKGVSEEAVTPSNQKQRKSRKRKSEDSFENQENVRPFFSPPPPESEEETRACTAWPGRLC